MKQDNLRSQLCATARYFYERGWMLGTAGNLSARNRDGSIWITASGKNKGELHPNDFLQLTPQGTPIYSPQPDLKPSAETSIHTAVYRMYPSVHACLHVHMLVSNWICEDHLGERIFLTPIEMLKGLNWPPSKGKASILVTENHPVVSDIAKELEQKMSTDELPGFLIRRHGITAWGKDIQEARNRIELFYYIFAFMCRKE